MAVEERGGYLHITLFAVFCAVFIWSSIGPRDRLTWLMEVLPALIAVALLFYTYRSFRLTGLAYALILLHSVILMVGGHYTYARVPLFDALRDAFHLSRNHYDRLGHFAQGFVPAIVVREILIRRSPVKRGGWLYFITVCIVLAASAFYEFIEWWVSVGAGARAEDFLGTQGDVWDTQWDMFMAFAGANVSLLALGRLHDRQLSGHANK